MSSQLPKNTKSSDSGGYQLPALGSRPSMTTTPSNPPTYHTLSGSSSSEPRPDRLSLPSHLDPPFAPHAPQARPLYSDFSGRQHGFHAQQPHTQGAVPVPNDLWPTRGRAQEVPSGAVSLPPLHPPENLRHAGMTGTTYEPLSPTEHTSHESLGRSSLFDDSTYGPRPYAPTVQSRYSPTESHQSSTTTSSGQLLRTQSGVRSTAPSVEAPSKSKGKIKEQDEFQRYIFKVRQQPEAARACGFGERDRRVIDPPAVVQLSFKDFDPESSDDLALLQYPFHIAHCSLFTVQSEPADDASVSDVTSVPDPSKVNALCRRLMGTLVASPFIGVDPEAPPNKNDDARLGCFFIFPDLSVRQTGRYRLRFTLMKVPMHEMIEGGQGSIAAFVDSDIFEVFVAGSFPGMSASSRLVKELKRQGAAVSLKKGVTPGKSSSSKRSGNASEKSGSEGSEEVDTSSTQARRRRRRG